jgi:cytochrome c556
MRTTSTRRHWLTALAVAALAVSVVSLAPAQPKTSRATKEFMREKLALAQRVLEGVTMEDYALIESRAKRLSAMSQEAPWQVLENPEYTQHSLTYRRQADALVRAAKEKNLDGATLAYVRLTMSCVDCHKFVRGKLVAQRDTNPSQRIAGNAGIQESPAP